MRIAQVAPPFERVPPVRYGGTERVVANLTEELVRMGHEVTLFATADARTSAELVPYLPRPVWHEGVTYADYTAFLSLALGAVAREAGRFDIIHSHVDHAAFPLARALDVPLVSTLHGRLDLPELKPLFEEFSEIPLVSISDAQRRPAPNARWVSTVYHGVAMESLPFQPAPGKYLAFLGRISPEKGVDAAIRVARRAGMPLLIAAREPLPPRADVSVEADWEYYENVVKPLLREPGVEFIGEVDEVQKQRFLGEAVALLFPIAWPEPFGLVMIEALACGTPVLGLRRGSVPEVVAHGVTGFVVDDEEGLLGAVGRLGNIDRAACRRQAERLFSTESMARSYLDVYVRLLDGEAAATPPDSELFPLPAFGGLGLLPAGRSEALLRLDARARP